MLKSVCCMSLMTAGQIISWISIVASLILTIIACFEINRINDQDDQYYRSKNENQVIHSKLLTGLLLNLFFSGLLVLGTFMKRHLLFLPWLIYSVILLTFGTVELLFFCILNIVKTPKYFFNAIGFSFLFLIALVIGMYFWCVIYSLYKQIKNSNKQKFPLIHNAEAMTLSNPNTSGNAGFVRM